MLVTLNLLLIDASALLESWRKLVARKVMRGPTFSSYGRMPRPWRSARDTASPSWMSVAGLASTCPAHAPIGASVRMCICNYKHSDLAGHADGGA
jgi:hypothetical protein